MFVAEKATGHLIEVLETQALFDPHVQEVRGSLHYGKRRRTRNPLQNRTWPFPPVKRFRCAGPIPDYRRHS